MKKYSKKINRILSIILAMLLFSGVTAFADGHQIMQEYVNGLPDLKEDILKYDIPYLNREDDSQKEEEKEEEVFVEELKYEKADNIMASLGIFEFEDGLFNEDEIVTYEAFHRAMMIIQSGDTSSVTGTETKAADENVTHIEAVTTLLDILGYIHPNDTKSYILRTAIDTDLLKGIQYKESKYITRGELSQLIYNALRIDLMEITSVGGSYSHYDTQDGKNLLYRTFGLIEISGLCTAQKGIDIYANTELDDDDISIDRHNFKANKNITQSFLGKRVYALCSSDFDINSLVYVCVDERDTSVTVNLNTLTISGGYANYTVDGKKKKVGLSSVDTVVYNGESVLSYDFSQLNGADNGSIIFASSQFNTNYDIAIISEYESFVVESLSKATDKKRLTFMYGAKFNGLTYFEFEDTDDVILHVTKNGVNTTINNVKPGDVVSLLASTDGTYIHIDATDKKVSGKIEAMINHDKVIIGKKEYRVSKAYLEASATNTKLVAPKVGITVSAKLNSCGDIVNMEITEDIYKLGLLIDFVYYSKGLDKAAQLSIYTDKSSWEIYDLAEEVVVDGSNKMSAKDTCAILEANREEILYKPVRYKVNKDGLVTFIDTKIKTRAEDNDPDTISLVTIWPSAGGTKDTDWTQGHNLKGTTYSLADDATIFYVPNDKDEVKFRIYKRTQIPADSASNFEIYNTDDFFCGKIIVYTSPDSSSSSFTSNIHLMISKLENTRSEDGNTAYKITGYLANGQGAIEMSLTTTSEVRTQFPNLKIGDTISYIINSDNEVSRLGLYATNEKVQNPANDQITLDDYNQAIGEVLAVDAATRMVKIRVGPEKLDKSNEYSFEERGCVLFDSATQEVLPISLSEICPGDRVFLRGLYRYDGIFVYR